MSTDDLLYFYRESSTFHHLLAHIYKFLPCTSQEVPVLKFINLWIIQYKHGISFDQTSRIKQTIADVCLPNPTDTLGMCDTPFRTYFTYGKQLVETLPVPPKDITSVDNKYGGLRFNAQIGKYPHVEIWSRPDLAYMKNRLSSYIVGNTVPVFIGPKCGAHYLNYNLHRPIMYPRGADIY